MVQNNHENFNFILIISGNFFRISKTHYFLFFLLFFHIYGVYVYGQDPGWQERIEFLKKKYPLAGNDSNRANINNDLGALLIETGSYDTALVYLRKALTLAQNCGYNSRIGIYYTNIGNAFYYKGDYDTALYYHVRGLNQKIKSGNKKDLGISYQNIGLIYEFWGQYGRALEYYIKSLENAEAINDSHGVAMGMMNIGLIYESLENYPRAMEYLNRGDTIFRLIGNDRGVGLCLMNKGNLLKKLEEYDKALTCFEEAFPLFEKSGDRYAVLHCFNNAGEIYKYTGRYEKAIEYYSKALEGLTDLGEKFGSSACYHNIGETYGLMGNYSRAHEFFEKSLSITKEINFKDLEKETYKIRAEIYARQKNFRRALDCYQTYSAIKDSMLNEQTSRQITEMQTKYETEKKEKEIKLQKAEIEKKEAVIRQQNIQRIALGVGILLMIVLAMIIYLAYRGKQKANVIITAQKKEVEFQKKLIEEKNLNITESIEYAGYIQKAVLPADEEFSRLFPESFILFRPRDIVSGDFYYLTPLPPSPEREGGVLLCIADCTGHGVPGAFMSMLCTALLNEAVNDKGITEPDKIFEDVRSGIIAALKQKGRRGEAKDGMDAVLISLQFAMGNGQDNSHTSIDTVPDAQCRLACANNPVYIVGNGKLREIKPDRFPVGVYEGEISPFTLQKTTLNPGDMLYAITDGFEDQLGGEKGKKFKSGRLRELLAATAAKPVDEQKQILETTLLEWKGSGEQTDDVTIVGIRI
ncbi:MAG: tetratricopeptide repeat protein [Bacteroidetes bacterium]|nr:tetratricopeptide repeat protein [Bacteroidota bacterium]